MGSSSPSSPVTTRPRLLLVDDEPYLLEAYRRLLGARYQVTVAGGGRQALELVDRDQAWHAVVCDIMMPDVDGLAVWRHLQANHPALAQRTVFCTAGAFTARSLAFVEEVRDRLLEKPVDPQKLEALMARAGARRGGP